MLRVDIVAPILDSSFMQKKEGIFRTVMIVVCFALVFCTFFVGRGRRQIREAASLELRDVDMNGIQDGIYEGSARTSYMRVVLEVSVSNHRISSINIVKNEGSRGQNPQPLLDMMIQSNRTLFVPPEGTELEAVVFMNAVGNALCGTEAEEK